jgi:thiazole synthase
MDDILQIGGQVVSSRLFVGTGKFTSYDLIPRMIEASGAQVVTVALRRMDFDAPTENMVNYLPAGSILMTNT